MNKERAEEIIGEIEAEYDELCEAIDICYISKDKIKEKIERYNTYGEQPYADETINNIVISELKELLKGE